MVKSIRNLLDSLDDDIDEDELIGLKPYNQQENTSNTTISPNSFNIPIPGVKESSQPQEVDFPKVENSIQVMIPEEIPKTYSEPENPSAKKKTSAMDMDKLLDSLIDQNKNKIIVVGVGGGGCNAINRLGSSNTYRDSVLVGANTDALHLRETKCQEKILLGLELTQGLGAGNDPVIGKAAAEESIDGIDSVLYNSDMVFVATGMGGGTGTGGAPIIAQRAKKQGALVVGVCTLPFEMEGENRARHALEGLREFYKSCDTVIVIPNEKLMELAPEMSISLAFKVADEILVRAVKGIVNLIKTPAYVNVDFADIRQILKQGGSSVIGMGEGEGENRVDDALRESLSNSLLDIQVMDCKAALINITGGTSLSLEEVQVCVSTISQEMGEDSEIIWGTHIDPSLGEKIQVTTILSGVSSPYNIDFTPFSKIEKPAIQSKSSGIKSIWD